MVPYRHEEGTRVTPSPATVDPEGMRLSDRGMEEMEEVAHTQAAEEAMRIPSPLRSRAKAEKGRPTERTARPASRRLAPASVVQPPANSRLPLTIPRGPARPRVTRPLRNPTAS